MSSISSAPQGEVGQSHLSRNLAIAAHSRRIQYGDIGPNMRLIIIAISTCGAINSEGIDFISHLASDAPIIPSRLPFSTKLLGPHPGWLL
jgi:hypothetical protein